MLISSIRTGAFVIMRSLRPWHELDCALIENRGKIGVLTDHVRTPASIAMRLLKYGFTQYKMYIGEHLGNPEKQRISRSLALSEVEEYPIDSPNCVILQRMYNDITYRPLGIPDIFPRFSISAQSSSCHGRPVRDTMVMSSYDTFSSCESICNELNEGRFTVIGIPDDPNYISNNKTIVDIINSNTYFSGGKRHHEIVMPFLPPDAVLLIISTIVLLLLM